MFSFIIQFKSIRILINFNKWLLYYMHMIISRLPEAFKNWLDKHMNSS